MTDAVRRVRSGSPWEESFGFSRAVAAGDRIVVGGTTSFRGDILHGEGDPAEQARVAFTNALAAIRELGAGPESVIRTRMYLTHARDADAVGAVHHEFFAAVRPVTTLVVVDGFVDPRILVEVELEAHRETPAPGPEESEQS
ncbi:RidA family protein [Streptomyces uncialis]|uniref:RidA family protein n=1 Tax=Streptomyces uncialis TaxID=1048205 RepID=UPI00364CB780